MIRNFNKDFEESNNPLIRKEWQEKLNLILKDCNITWHDKKDIQLGFGIDITFTYKNGRRYTGELKTTKYIGDTYLLEISHHLYNDLKQKFKLKTSAGWLYKSTADVIFWATIKDNKIIKIFGHTLIPFKEESYKKIISNLNPAWASTIFENGTYQLTLNKIISTEQLKKDALKIWEWTE